MYIWSKADIAGKVATSLSVSLSLETEQTNNIVVQARLAPDLPMSPSMYITIAKKIYCLYVPVVT